MVWYYAISKLRIKANDFRLIRGRTTGTTVHRAAALRPGVVVRGFIFLQSPHIRVNAWRRSYGGSTEIRRRSRFWYKPIVLPLFGSRTRSYRRPTNRRGSEKWYLGGSAELSPCQEFYATFGKGITELSTDHQAAEWYDGAKNLRGERGKSFSRFVKASHQELCIQISDYG